MYYRYWSSVYMHTCIVSNLSVPVQTPLFLLALHAG